MPHAILCTAFPTREVNIFNGFPHCRTLKKTQLWFSIRAFPQVWYNCKLSATEVLHIASQCLLHWYCSIPPGCSATVAILIIVKRETEQYVLYCRYDYFSVNTLTHSVLLVFISSSRWARMQMWCILWLDELYCRSWYAWQKVSWLLIFALHQHFRCSVYSIYLFIVYLLYVCSVPFIMLLPSGLDMRNTTVLFQVPRLAVA